MSRWIILYFRFGFFSLCLLVFGSPIAVAQILEVSGITHGVELEFTNDWIYEINSSELVGKLRGREIIAAEAMANKVIGKCKMLGCRVSMTTGKWQSREWRVTLENGWWFQISYDPLCVEIQTRPSTLQELYQVQPLMEKLIFESAFESGLEVRPNRSAHLNTGARSAFGYDVVGLFNYLVDHANHPEFSSGLFRKNWLTAPPLAALGEDPTLDILRIQDSIQNGRIRTFSNLANVVGRTLHQRHLKPKDFVTTKNQDLGFLKLTALHAPPEFSFLMTQDQPMEHRGYRALNSFLEFVLHAELIETRIQWVKAQEGFIPYSFKPAHEISPAAGKQFFKNWLQEMNAPVNRYLPLVQSTSSGKKKKPPSMCTGFYKG